MLRPGFRAAGAEVNDIELDGKYAGTMTLAYREGDRLVGAIQLDQAGLSSREKENVSRWIGEYVHSLADALRVDECEVLVTFGPFDHIITAYPQTANEVLDEQGESPLSSAEYDPGRRGRSVRPEESRRTEARTERASAESGGTDKNDLRPLRLELVIVGERGNRVEYHIYGDRKEWKAEAFFTIEENDVYGEVNWMYRPDEAEMEAAADLIVSDFDEDEIDTFRIEMKHEGSVLETFELAHEDLLPEEEWESSGNEKQYTVVLVRDDADTLTYDIYEQTQGGLPIGRATVDISSRRMTGMIDFRDPIGSEEREKMATALLRELDKEKDYDSLNLTMIHRNNRIENIYFENEHVH